MNLLEAKHFIVNCRTQTQGIQMDGCDNLHLPVLILIQPNTWSTSFIKVMWLLYLYRFCTKSQHSVFIRLRIEVMSLPLAWAWLFFRPLLYPQNFLQIKPWCAAAHHFRTGLPYQTRNSCGNPPTISRPSFQQFMYFCLLWIVRACTSQHIFSTIIGKFRISRAVTVTGHRQLRTGLRVRS